MMRQSADWVQGGLPITASAADALRCTHRPFTPYPGHVHRTEVELAEESSPEKTSVCRFAKPSASATPIMFQAGISAPSRGWKCRLLNGKYT